MVMNNPIFTPLGCSGFSIFSLPMYNGPQSQQTRRLRFRGGEPGSAQLRRRVRIQVTVCILSQSHTHTVSVRRPATMRARARQDGNTRSQSQRASEDAPPTQLAVLSHLNLTRHLKTSNVFGPKSKASDTITRYKSNSLPPLKCVGIYVWFFCSTWKPPSPVYCTSESFCCSSGFNMV